MWLFVMISVWDWHFEQVKIRTARAKLCVLHSSTAAGRVLTQQTLQGGMHHSECSLKHILSSETAWRQHSNPQCWSYCSPACPERLALLKVSSPISGRRKEITVLLWVTIFAAICTFAKKSKTPFAKHGRANFWSLSKQPSAQVALPLQLLFRLWPKA